MADVKVSYDRGQMLRIGVQPCDRETDVAVQHIAGLNDRIVADLLASANSRIDRSPESPQSAQKAPRAG
jgi:hypothetical protein